jgi:hypothetical protein
MLRKSFRLYWRAISKRAARNRVKIALHRVDRKHRSGLGGAADSSKDGKEYFCTVTKPSTSRGPTSPAQARIVDSVSSPAPGMASYRPDLIARGPQPGPTSPARAPTEGAVPSRASSAPTRAPPCVRRHLAVELRGPRPRCGGTTRLLATSPWDLTVSSSSDVGSPASRSYPQEVPDMYVDVVRHGDGPAS